MDDEEAKKRPQFTIGQNLEDMSVDELDDTVLLLKEEIQRLSEASTAKSKHLSAAQALFSKK